MKLSSEQNSIRDCESLSLAISAPAGCGKTEVLALRVAGMIQRKQVRAPRKILVLTFSNKAKDNIRERLRHYLSKGEMREYVTIANLHGFSARIFQSHARSIGLDPNMQLPESDWITAKIKERRLKQDSARVLQECKLRSPSDDELIKELTVRREHGALELEKLRIADNRLTYDDLPRFADLILQNDAIASLYRAHFAAVVVDEYQDLTPQQMRIIKRIGYGKTTFAGDLSQAIYSFAGAKPELIREEVEAQVDRRITLSESYRSAPAVLNMVNSLLPVTGGATLVAASPASWPVYGVAGLIHFEDDKREATEVLDLADLILKQCPRHRIGILCRNKFRRRVIDAFASKLDQDVYVWDDHNLDGETARSFRKALNLVDLTEFNASADKAGYIRELVYGSGMIPQQDTFELDEAVGWCVAELTAEKTIDQLAQRICAGSAETLIDSPGIHLLNGHAGKGQQFDWVFIIGAEERVIPSYRLRFQTPAEQKMTIAEEGRVLSVMLSRARFGVVVTSASSISARPQEQQRPTRYENYLLQGSPLKGKQVRNALEHLPWSRIRIWDGLSFRAG